MLTAEDDPEDEMFMRQLVLPEEDRLRLYPTMKGPAGGYRWFRSPNVVPIEKYRKSRSREADTVARTPTPRLKKKAHAVRMRN
jgi:hypothetical protein